MTTAPDLPTGPFTGAAARLVDTDRDAMAAAAARHAQLTKPAGSLGRLEELGILLAGITGRCPPPVAARPPSSRCSPAITAWSHRASRRGRRRSPRRWSRTSPRGGAAINVLARQVGAAVHVVDVGVAADRRRRRRRARTARCARAPTT